MASLPNEEQTNKPARTAEPAPEWAGPRSTVVSYHTGALPGCLIAAGTFAVFMVVAVVLLVAGVAASLFGGRRLAAALLRRAKFSPARPFTFSQYDDPGIIDITPGPDNSRGKP